MWRLVLSMLRINRKSEYNVMWCVSCRGKQETEGGEMLINLESHHLKTKEPGLLLKHHNMTSRASQRFLDWDK
jgi:hypothetical protein